VIGTVGFAFRLSFGYWLGKSVAFVVTTGAAQLATEYKEARDRRQAAPASSQAAETPTAPTNGDLT
jgi:hypothetical protein